MGRGPEPAIMLTSEHKLLLDAAQERYRAARGLERRLYWHKGFTAALWAIGFASLFAFVLGLNVAYWTYL
jgi:hypothetical protein